MSMMQLVGRASWGIAGLLWFVWLGYEDRSVNSVFVLAAALALAGGIQLYRNLSTRLSSAAKSRLWLFIFSGGLAGLLVSVIAIMLMLVKISLHGHSPPDFSNADLLTALKATPAWFAAGIAIGLGAGLAVKALKPQAG